MFNTQFRNPRLACALVLTHAALLACTAPAPSHGSSADDEAIGRLELALTGGSASGQAYRLREGLIDITGSSSATFSSEDYLDSNLIQVDLLVGGYLAGLADGWYLERELGDDWEVVPARLISTNPQPFEVFDQQLTGVVLRFQAGDDIIEFGSGRVQVSIFVEDGMAPPPDGDCVQACDDAAFLGCTFQEACVVICEDLSSALGSPDCVPLADDYVACAADEPGMSYVCSSDYPIASACEPQFMAVLDCVIGSCTDMDGDSSCAETGDCDDSDPSVGPGAVEICDDGIDNDCDGAPDGDDTDCMNVPGGWTCPVSFYGGGDGCDCGCGVPDPDCNGDPSVAVCEWCDDMGSCSQSEPGCPGLIDPMDNASCVPLP